MLRQMLLEVFANVAIEMGIAASNKLATHFDFAILAGTAAASTLLGAVNGIFAFLTGPTIGEVALLLTAIVLLRLMPRGITGSIFRKSL